LAQQKPAKPAETPTGALPQQSQQPQLEIPSRTRLDLLIRSTLMALDHANQSGNYSVLRDLGSPAFQRFYTASALSDRFVALRKAKIDFSPILFFHPQMTAEPTLQEGRFLRLVGFMPTKPQQINFDLAYQNIEGQWLLVALSVNMSEGQRLTSRNDPAPKPAKPAAAARKPPAENAPAGRSSPEQPKRQ
jgi:hypothetical protein